MARATRNWIPNDKALNDGMAKIKQIAEAAIIESLSELAETSINYALDYKGYHNITYNLHDSYGYAIFHRGVEVKKWMNPPRAYKTDARGGFGADWGSIILSEFDSTGDWQLVVVAGESYAEWHERFRVKYADVLTHGYQYTEQHFLRDFKKIQ